VLDSRATPVPSNPSLLDSGRGAWHGQLTAQGVAQLTNTGAGLRQWLVGDGSSGSGIGGEGGGLLPASMEEARAAVGHAQVESS
jgi:hypothetical protein